MSVAALVVGAVVTLGFATRDARADGDPASDVLVTQSIFLPYPLPGAPAQQALSAAVRSVYRRGLRIKVAVIASPNDLGAVPSLFGHPADYARSLGLELQFVYKGPRADRSAFRTRRPGQ